MSERFWDMFYRGRWVGMVKGADLYAAIAVAEGCQPHLAGKMRYAEWFGRHDPRNCVTSGGGVPDPT